MLPISVKDVEVKLTKFPKIALIICTKNKSDYIETCIKSINKQIYFNKQIYLADTGSNMSEYKKIERICNENNVKLFNYSDLCKDGFNFSKVNNQLVKEVDKDIELLLFVNNDTEMINNVLEQMVIQYELNKHLNIGTVGCTLSFYEGSIQHNGVFIQEVAVNNWAYGHENMWTWDYRADTREIFANTGAMLMIKKELFELIGGFDESFESVFQDVKLNIECIKRGYKNLVVHSAICYHDESSSRKDDKEDDNKLQRDLKKLNEFVKENYIFVKDYLKNKGV